MEYDAWDVEEWTRGLGSPLGGVQSVDVVDHGPLVATLRVRRAFGRSTMEQLLTVRAGSPRIDFSFDVDWQEDEQLLSLMVPLDVHAREAACDIQFGHVMRPTHASSSWDAAKFEVCAHRYVDLSEPGFGVAVLNDGRYGHSVQDGGIRVSLLRAAKYPDPVQDHGRHRVTISVLPHGPGLHQVLREAEALNIPLRPVQGNARFARRAGGCGRTPGRAGQCREARRRRQRRPHRPALRSVRFADAGGGAHAGAGDGGLDVQPARGAPARARRRRRLRQPDTPPLRDRDGAAVQLSRVLYLEAAVDPGAAGLTPDEVRSVPWGEPTWADDGQLRLANCAWVVSGGGHHVVVDPAGNLDEILHDRASTGHHQRAYRNAFAEAGVPIESVDIVLLSHIESVGLAAVRTDDGDGWQRFFPNARVVISEAARRDFDESPPSGELWIAFASLIDAGVVDTYADGDEIAPGVRAEWTGMHNPGHCAFHVGDDVTFVGHLAVSPLHFATGPCPPQHADPDGAWEWLQRIAADGRVLIGPLWPTPGAIRLTADGFQPVSG